MSAGGLCPRCALAEAFGIPPRPRPVAAVKPGAMWRGPGESWWRMGERDPVTARIAMRGQDGQLSELTLEYLLNSADWRPATAEELVGLAVEPAREPVPPDLVGAVIGYRSWAVPYAAAWLRARDLEALGVRIGREMIPLRLHSTGLGAMDWEPGTNVAECRDENRPPVSHRAPDPGCGCGLYAWHDPPITTGGVMFQVTGLVRAWGDLQVHASGFRAEYAEVVAISSRQIVRLDGRRDRRRELLEELARVYGAEVVEPGPDALREAAERAGGEVPRGLRPDVATRFPRTYRALRWIERRRRVLQAGVAALGLLNAAFFVDDLLTGIHFWTPLNLFAALWSFALARTMTRPVLRL